MCRVMQACKRYVKTATRWWEIGGEFFFNIFSGFPAFLLWEQYLVFRKMVQVGKLRHSWAGKLSGSTHILPKLEQVWSVLPRDAPLWGSPLALDLRLEAQWPSHNFSVQSLDLSSHSWQKNSKKPQEERRHGPRGPGCVWDEGGDARHPAAPSGRLEGRSQSSAGPHCSCASPGPQAQPSPPPDASC